MKVWLANRPHNIHHSSSLASDHVQLIPLCSLRRLRVVLSFFQFTLMTLFWLGVMTLVFFLRRLISNNTLAFVTWGVLDTFWGLSLHIRTGSLLWPSESMPLTCLRRQDFLGASHRPRPWKVAHSFGILHLHSLRMLTAIGDCWASWYISPSLALILYKRLGLESVHARTSISSLKGSSMGSSIHQASPKERAHLSMTRSSLYWSLLWRWVWRWQGIL